MLNSVEPLVEEGLGGRAVNGTATPAAFAGPRGGGMVAGGAVSPIVDPVVDPNPSVPEVMDEPGGVGWYDWFGGERGPPVLLADVFGVLLDGRRVPDGRRRVDAAWIRRRVRGGWWRKRG